MADMKKAIRMAMAIHDKTVVDISSGTGVSRQTIYGSFFYSPNPKLSTIESVASFFGMQTSDFIALGE